MQRSAFLGSILAGAALLGLAPGPARAARPELVSISVLPQTASLIPGQGLALRAIGHFEDGSTADITRKVVFKENTPVAKLEKNVVVARAPGTVEIRAVTKSGSLTSNENLALEVSTIVALELDPATDGIRLTDAIQWSARATLMNGATGIDVTPLMDWSSTDPSVVHMGSRNKIRGLAKARTLGTATIEARDPESGESASLALTVVSELSTLAVAPSSRFLQLDDATTFRAVGTFEGGHEADLSDGVTWASEDESIARIDKSGVATPEAIGSVEIRATDKATGIGSEDSGGNAELIVVGDLISLAVDPASHAMAVGEVERFRALGSFEDAAGTFAMGSRVDWFSSDAGVAAVEADGDVECLAPGAAVISARHKKSGITSTDTDEDGALTCTEL